MCSVLKRKPLVLSGIQSLTISGLLCSLQIKFRETTKVLSVTDDGVLKVFNINAQDLVGQPELKEHTKIELD